jgi:ribosomal protein S18 acetylase RimI-like enzyme
MQTSITSWFKQSAAVKQSISTATAAVAAAAPPPPHDAQLRVSQTQTQTSPSSITTSNNVSQTQVTTTESSTPQTSHLASFFTNHMSPPLITNISLVACDATNITSFQRLNALLLPIPYPQSFYNEILADPVAADLTILAVWHDDISVSAQSARGQGRVIGGIRCRILSSIPSQTSSSSSTPSTSNTQNKILYISTLAVLSPYRSYGVATHLLQTVMARGARTYNINQIGAHVWEASPEAREWYRKRGFTETYLEKGYYRRLNPQGAYVLSRHVGTLDFLSLS